MTTQNYIQTFNTIFDAFKQTSLFTDMENMVENNDWHLEANVGVHTEMVVDQYIDRLPSIVTHQHFLGALACMLHDIGKPVVCEEIIKDDGSIRLTSPGHELESARLAEDYLASEFGGLFNGIITPSDITKICWLIQNHLFYGITNHQKVRDLKTTSRYFVSSNVSDDDFDDIFIRCITADAMGRIGTDPQRTERQLHEWIDKYNSYDITQPQISIDAPTMVVLIGPSGAGKSTYRTNLEHFEHFNWDDLRVEKYKDLAIENGMESESDIYNFCWEQSCHPDKKGNFSSDFNKFQNERLKHILNNKLDVVIDNTNLSRKRYADIVQRGRQKGYQVVAVLFPVSINTLLDRLENRSDRNMCPGVVINMFKRQSIPALGRLFDGINVWGGNLWDQHNTKS